jgi:hypothetical protein
MMEAPTSLTRTFTITPSRLVKEVVLDKVWIKHWEYKSWITFKLFSLKIRKLHE